jgi:hypothetical protein
MTIKEEKLTMDRIPQIEKELKELDDLITEHYKKNDFNISHEYYKEHISPLHDRMDYLERLKNRIIRFNVKVGDGVTIYLYSDSHAATVIKRTKYSITIQQDRAIRIDNNGMSESQEYRYERNPKGEITTYRWSNKYGCFCNSGDQSIKIGNGRYEYYDYSF